MLSPMDREREGQRGQAISSRETLRFQGGCIEAIPLSLWHILKNACGRGACLSLIIELEFVLGLLDCRRAASENDFIGGSMTRRFMRAGALRRSVAKRRSDRTKTAVVIKSGALVGFLAIVSMFGAFTASSPKVYDTVRWCAVKLCAHYFT